MSYSYGQSALASERELNHYLRRQVVDLLLSIAILKEANAQDARGADANVNAAEGSQSAHLAKCKARRLNRVKRCDRQL